MHTHFSETQFDAYLFDLDGTLIDSEMLWVEAIALALDLRNVPDAMALSQRLVYGRSWPDIWEDIRTLHPNAYPSRKAIEGVTVPEFQRLHDARDIRIQPSIDLLLKLALTAPIAIVSGSTSDRIAESIEYARIGDAVRAYVGCDDYKRGKPDPEGYLQGAALLGVEPTACLVFEDSTAGVLAAKAAGMSCVVLRNEHGPIQNFDSADLVLDSLAEFAM
ncbi:MAG: HAD family phosphatase [Lentisphaeria bacterium]|nr:HAD family phosphatase [Lentisphaeria bacterium]